MKKRLTRRQLKRMILNEVKVLNEAFWGPELTDELLKARKRVKRGSAADLVFRAMISAAKNDKKLKELMEALYNALPAEYKESPADIDVFWK